MVRPNFTTELEALYARRTAIEKDMDRLVDETTEVLGLPPGK